jgi:dipeptidyl aminopeptidase/acylaminoacyl peptidase
MKRHMRVLGVLLFFCAAIGLVGQFAAGGQTEEGLYTREVIRFDSRQFKIVGDLHLPDPGKKQPVIIWVHGDGPARRSLSGRPNRIMRSFLDTGFACFYYDKPGYGESTGEFSRGKLFEERAAILVDAVKVLKNHPAVEPGQIGLWGISQAGWVMPLAIAATKDIAFMIAISCAGTDGVEQSAYLVEKQVLCEGYSKEEAKTARLYYSQRAHAQNYEEYLEAAEYLDKNPVVSAMRWGGIQTEEQFSPRPNSHQNFFNPMALIEKMTIPILAIYGDKDTQVDPFQAMEAYEKALKKAGNPLSRVEIFPGADHGIISSKTGCLKEQRERRGANYAPGFIELMLSWLERLKDWDFAVSSFAPAYCSPWLY